MRSSRVASVVAAGLLAAAGLGACDPPPPRPQFTVNTLKATSDEVPGDGVCGSVGADECSLSAAIVEANALGKADIHLPAGEVSGLDGLTVTGDVALFGQGVGVTSFGGYSVTVAPGATLAVTDVGQITTLTDQRLTIGGSLVLTRTSIQSNAGPAIVVLGGAGAVIVDSGLNAVSGTIHSEGATAIIRSTIAGGFGEVHRVSGAGSSGWASTVLVTAFTETGCAGTRPTSSGYNRTDSDCGLSAEGDGSATFGDLSSAFTFTPRADSALVDAVPLGVAGCSATARDMYGNPRGVDGNGDGVPGCDIGAVELQPTASA